MIENNHHHGAGAQEDGEAVELVVGDHDGDRTARASDGEVVGGLFRNEAINSPSEKWKEPKEEVGGNRDAIGGEDTSAQLFE